MNGAGANEDPLRRKKSAKTVITELQQTLSVHNGKDLLGQINP